MKSYGIDFGTTNSAVSFNNDGHIEVLELGMGGAKHLPSLLYFSGDRGDYTFGDDAALNYQIHKMHGRLLRSIKTCLPNESFTGTQIDGWGFMRIEDIIALMLKDLKKRADVITGEDVTTVVVGRPAKFSENEQEDQLAEKRLRKAAEVAGFKDISFAAEPLAAAYSYEQDLTQKELVLIADMGGGTSDFTLMHLGRKDKGVDRQADVVGIDGIYIGGDRLDANLCREGAGDLFGKNATWFVDGKRLPFPATWITYISEWHRSARVNIKEVNAFFSRVRNSVDDIEGVARLEAVIRERSSYSLSKAVEQAKINLSERPSTIFMFNRGSVDVEKVMTRDLFEEANDNDANRIVKTATDLLVRSGVMPSDVGSVFLTGGTSRVPLVRNKFSEIFGIDKIKGRDDLLSVAHGLGLLCGQAYR